MYAFRTILALITIALSVLILTALIGLAVGTPYAECAPLLWNSLRWLSAPLTLLIVTSPDEDEEETV